MNDLVNSELFEARHQFKERRANGWFFILLAAIFCAMAVAITYWKTTFGGVQISGPSMQNTLYNGEYLLMRYYHEGDELPYGSVIILDVEHYPEVQASNAGKPESERTKYLIKRLIAKEGDVVRCKDGIVQVRYAGDDEFTTLDEPYARYGDMGEYDFVADYVVGEGEIFFLGDNRDNSLDSRYREGKSHLNTLYKESDIYGVIPDWALEHKQTLEKIFFWRERLALKRN